MTRLELISVRLRALAWLAYSALLSCSHAPRGFGRVSEGCCQKTRECVWMRECCEVFDAKFASSKQNCMDYGLLSRYILDNNSPERPTRAPEHALARFLSASRVNPIETQMCPRNSAGTSAFSLGCLRTVGPAGWSCHTSGPHERTSIHCSGNRSPAPARSLPYAAFSSCSSWVRA